VLDRKGAGRDWIAALGKMRIVEEQVELRGFQIYAVETSEFSGPNRVRQSIAFITEGRCEAQRGLCDYLSLPCDSQKCFLDGTRHPNGYISRKLPLRLQPRPYPGKSHTRSVGPINATSAIILQNSQRSNMHITSSKDEFIRRFFRDLSPFSLSIPLPRFARTWEPYWR